MNKGKVVLISTSRYVPSRDEPLLRELIESKIELFCAVGIDAQSWEDALDWLCVDIGSIDGPDITTTSHPGETEDDVVEFARQFFTERKHDVEIIRV